MDWCQILDYQQQTGVKTDTVGRCYLQKCEPVVLGMVQRDCFEADSWKSGTRSWCLWLQLSVRIVDLAVAVIILLLIWQGRTVCSGAGEMLRVSRIEDRPALATRLFCSSEAVRAVEHRKNIHCLSLDLQLLLQRWEGHNRELLTCHSAALLRLKALFYPWSALSCQILRLHLQTFRDLMEACNPLLCRQVDWPGQLLR
jgi:hypothetical protein